MNISELRDKLASIAEELAEQDVEQVEEGNASGMLRQLGQDPKYFPDAQIDPTENKGVYELLASNGEHVAYILMNDDGGATIALANGDDYDLADEENAETTLQSMYQEINGDSDMEESVDEFAEEDDLELEEAEIEEVAEEEVEETVEIPVSELNAIMQLAGFDGYKQVDEYANEPEEEYMDIEDQVIGLSGGLNGPKDMHTPAAGGDNPMDKEALKTVEESLYKSYKSFLEEAEIEDNA